MAAGGADLGSLIASLGGGGGQGGGMPQGPPPGPPTDQPDQAGTGDPLEILQSMVDAAQQYIGVEPDHEDKAVMTKILALVQGLFAKDQKDRDQAMGGGNMRLIRKAG